MSNMDERRRAPRVNLMGQLRGELVSVDTPVVVREISLGGMSLETGTAFEVNSRHEFMLTLGDGAGVLVLGRVAYCRTVEQPDGGRFIIGIQFLDEDAGDGGPDVGGLIDRVR